MKRWVAYERTRADHARAILLIEAETEREALCLAADRILHLSGAAGAPFAGPMVHVCPADQAPAADLAQLERRQSMAS